MSPTPLHTATEWRAYVGPVFRSSTSAAFYDWSQHNDTQAYNPLSAIPETTVASSVNFASDSQITLTNGTGYPNAGGFWIGPGSGAGEVWAYTEYFGKSGNVVNILRPDYKPSDSEYNGLHTVGGTVPKVRFWWELDVNDGTLQFSEFAEGNLNAINWKGRISGISFPVPAMRKNHMILVQKKRTPLVGVGSAWEILLLGWIDTFQVEDNYKRERTWTCTFSSIAGRMLQLEADGVRAGSENVQRRITVAASSTLAATYKEASRGEFRGAEPDISPQRAADAENTPPWISERYIGQNNAPVNPNTTYDGIRAAADCVISQLHISRYPGQPPGYRWIELTFLQNVVTFKGVLTLSEQTTVGSITGDPYTRDYFIDFDGSALDGAHSAGDTVIIAESPTLFARENPDNDATIIIGIDQFQYATGVAQQWKLEVDAGVTQFKLVETSTTPDDETGFIFPGITDDAGIEAEMEGSFFQVDEAHTFPHNTVLTSTSPIFLVVEKDFSVPYGNDASLITGSVSGGVATVTKVVNGTANFFGGKVGAADFFNLFRFSHGALTLHNTGGTAAWSTLRWGTFGQEPALGDDELWQNIGGAIAPNLTLADGGETARYYYYPSFPGQPSDYWQVGNVATPGYNPNGTEWVLMTLPGIELELKSDIDGVVTTFTVGNVGGDTGDGLPLTGTLQIGAEQMTYSSLNRSTGIVSGITRGANATLAVAHLEGDLIHFLDDMRGNLSVPVSTDANLIKKITLYRPTGRPKISDFTIRLSSFKFTRTFGDAGYTNDFVTLPGWIFTNATWTAGSEYDTWTLDLTATPFRVRQVLLEITKMSTQPYRAMVNETDMGLDNSVADPDSYIDDAPIGATMEQLCLSAGIPAGALNDTTTVNASDYTTAKGSLWRTLLDLADFGAKRIVIGRASKLFFSDDAYWAPTGPGLPGAADHTGIPFSRDELNTFDFEWVNGHNVGQIKLLWRSPDGNTEGDVVFPADSARDESGLQETIGPLIYVNETAAQNAAKRYFYIRRRPHSFIGDVVGSDTGYRPLQFRGAGWVLGAGYRLINRTFLTDRVEHEIKEGVWSIVISGVQVDREDHI